MGQLVVLGLVAGSIPVLLQSASALPSNFVAIDGSILKTSVTSTYDWGNSGPTRTVSASNVVSVAGTGGIFDGGKYQGPTTPPVAPPLTPQAANDPTIAHATFVPVPLQTDTTACGTGQPQVFSSGLKSGSAINALTWGLSKTTNKDQISDIYSLSHVTGTGSAAKNEIFFGAERTNPNGDTHIDFEFLQSSVTTNADANGCAPSTGGTFAGHRTEGDLLASVDISGNGTPTFGLYRWQCASTSGPIGVVCDPTSNSGFPQYVLTSNPAVTLATNNATIPCGGWACRDDSGALISTLVPDLFMEGGIDLNAAGFGTGCFNTFLPHTRTSGSISSNLGEFAGPIVFSNCETPNVSTTLRSGAQSGQSISVPAGSAVSDTATLTNTTSNPSGTLTYQVFTDPNCTVASTSPAVSQTVSVAADGVVQPSSNVTFPTGGTYYWQATYNGSTAGRDLPAKSPCNEILTVQSAGISIKKTADASPVSAGSQVGFTIGVTSTGSGQVNGVNVTDTLPTTPGTVWTATPTVGTCSTTGGVLACTLGSLNAGQSASIHLTSPSTPASCGTIPNTASVTTTNDGGGSSSASLVVNCPTLTINKVPVTPTVTAGGPVAFNIGVTNTTTGTATGVTITDPLPNTGVAWTYSPASQPCTISGPINAQVLNCTVGNLNQGQGFNVQVSSPSSLSTAGSIPNTATATAINAPSVSSTASVAVNHPDITITKTADKTPVDAGAQVGFTIMVQNAGPGDANGVTVTDTLPALAGTSWSLDSGNTTAVGCTITGNVLTCPNQTIPAPPTNNGQIAVHVVATTNQSDCGTIQNVASFQANNDGRGTSTPAATITINCANVNFVKKADQSPVTAGDPIGFTITATNTGAGAATNVSVTDTLPSAPGVSWTVASVSPAGVSCVNNAGTLDCTLASLAAGATMVIHLTSPTTAASAGACTNGTATINNTATLMIGNAMGGQSGDTITVDCPSLSIQKKAASTSISAGDVASYSVTVTNAGPGTARGVTLTDTLPAGVSWTITSQPAGTPSPCAINGAGVLNCSFGDLAAGASASVSVSGTTSIANCAAALNNSASTGATNLPASDTTTTASASITVNCPALGITKTPDATPISAGDPIGFTVAVTNTAATGVAHGFTVSDPLPSGTGTLTWSIASQSNAGLCSISGAAGSQVLACGGPTTNLAAGQVITVHITAQTSGATTSPVVNQVTASATNAPTQTATGTVVINHASVTTSKTPDAATVSLGDPIGFTIAVTNTASGASGPITVTDTLPSAPGISWTVAPPTTAGVTCVNNAGTLVCTVPSLGLNGTAVIHLTSPTTAATGGACTSGFFSITNSALITSQNDGGGNPSGSVTVDCPSLSIQKKAASASISAGDVASYSVTVTNAGPGTARGVTLTDTLPAGVSWTITSQPAGTPSPCAINGAGVLNCSFGDLAAGASASVSVSGTTSIANCAAALNNSASTGATNLPASDTTTTSSASITVNCPALGITKTAVASPISAGDPIGFTIVIANTSSSGTAQGVVVSDPLPSSNGTLTWSITSQSPAGACSIGGTAGAQTLNCGPTNLGPGQSITVQIGATTASGTGATVSNTATAMSSNNPTVSSTATVVVNHPNTIITKTADRSSVSSGDTIGYTITVDNSAGTGPANGVTITDTLPAGFTWQVDAVSTTATGCGISGGVLTCANNTIPAGGSIHVHISASTAGVACATIQNSARATVQNGSTITTQAPAQITINCPNLQFTKTADHATANEGDTIGYVIQVTNTSTAGNAYGVTVTDTLPPVTGTSWSLDAAGTSPGANCALTGNTLTCTIGTLAPGATIRIHVTATTTPTTCGSINNSANLTAINAAPQHTTVTTIVVGCPNLMVGKSASAATALPGGVVSFTIGVTNTGDAPGTTTVSDTYAPATITGTVPANCTNFAVTSTLSCQVTVPAGQTVNIVYQAQMPTTFSGTGGQPPCNVTGEFPVVNHVTITGGGSAQATVCVLANPSLSLHKSASSINAVGGQTLVFSLNYVNGGPGSAQNVVVTDPLPPSLTVGSCSNNCSNIGQTVTWTVGTVPPGTNATLTVTTTVNSNVGCSVCNQASMTSPSQNNGAPILSNNLCLVGVPGPNPAGAHASGNALGLKVNVSALLNLLAVRATLSQASSSQTGVGSNGNHQQVATVNVNLGGLGGVLTADLLSTQSNAVITASPAEAKDTSVAETANLNILNGLVRADVIRAVAATDANGSSSSFDAAGSGIAGLVINGVAYGTVTQTLTVGLPALVFGPNSYVSVLQQVGTTSGPASGQNSGGTYAANLQVTGIHVHITGILAVIASADIIVSQATAHSDFPQTTICATGPVQAVSGHAFILSEQTDPSLLPILLGLSAIPSSGGHAHSDLVNANALGVAIAGTLNTDALGTITPTQSQSVDSANVANVCVIPTGLNTCVIQAKAITSKSSSTANASGASSNDTGTQFVNLKVLGVDISVQVLPNTFINLPGIGAVILNEQFCDNGGLTFTHTCTGTHHSGLTVRAIDVVVDNFQNGGILPIGAQVIVAEAHSDATFGP